MTANHIIEQLKKGPATLDGLKLRLEVAGVKINHLQNMLDGLVLFGDLMFTHTPSTGKWWYALAKEPEWHCADEHHMVEVLSKHPEKKLDWGRFKLNPFAEPRPVNKPRVPVTDDQILSVIEHDAPSTAKIVHRLTNLLRRKPFEINFYDIRTALNRLQEQGEVFYLKPTQTTEGGWFKPRKRAV